MFINRYFITFINDFSRYGHVELIHEKSESLEVFKVFKAKVKLQKGKRIKAVNSNKSGEYYGRYDETEEILDLLQGFYKNAVLMRYIQC